MPISVTCPQCSVQHIVGDDMAGQQAQCNCGQLLLVPGVAAPPTVSGISMSCPACGQQYVTNQLAPGGSVQCSCGQPMIVPSEQPVGGDLGGLLDEIDQHQAAQPTEPELDPRQPDPALEARKLYAQALKYAMDRSLKGIPATRIYRELLEMNYHPETAQHVVLEVAPRSEIERMVARHHGWKHIKIGGITFLIGVVLLVGTAVAFQNVIVLLPIGISIFGFFHLLYGLLSSALGKR